MNTKAQRIEWLAHAVVAATVALGGVNSASAANGGTINFIGMIVAPPLDVSAAVVPPASSSHVMTQASASSPVVAVTFKAPPGAVSSADVSLMINDSTAPRTGAAALDVLAARFTDGNGHMVAADPNGDYHVGSNGATLLLGAKPGDQPSAGKAVTVMMSYD